MAEIAKILEMLKEGRLTIEEAERLIKAVSESKEKEHKKESKWHGPDFQDFAQEIGQAFESIQVGKFLDNVATKIKSSISTGFDTTAGTYVDKSIDATGIDKLKVKHAGGNITVYKTDASEFTIKGMLRTSKVEEGILTLSSGGGNLSVGIPSTVKDVEVEAGSGNATINNIKLEKLKSETTGGNLSISDVSGSISASAIGGNIDMTNVKSTELYAKSIGGQIRLIMGDLSEGKITLDSTAGGVNFFTDENSAFDLDAEIIGGSLESNLELEMLENGPVKYRAKYNDEGASVLVKVRHGDVEVGKR